MIVFGTTPDGRDVHKITLAAGDLTVDLLTWGAIVQDVRLAGVARSLTRGSEDLTDYLGKMCYHGALIGPIANRISNARVRIDGMMYELERNQDGRIHLHSGADATHRQIWTVADHGPAHAVLTLALPDGMCGLPGNRQVTAHFSLEAPASMRLTITGATDAATLMNFANHSYWNLDGSLTWEGHQLQIMADDYLPTTPDNAPTGERAQVAGTLMDFRQPRAAAPGAPALDHNFCLSDGPAPLRKVLELTGQSGLSMMMETTAPGMQVFDGRPGYAALAFEAQDWPDAPNHPRFPQILVAPGQDYHQLTRWSFARPGG